MCVTEQSIQIARGYANYAHGHHKFVMKPGNVQTLTIYCKLTKTPYALKGKWSFLFASDADFNLIYLYFFDVDFNFKAIRFSFSFPL